MKCLRALANTAGRARRGVLTETIRTESKRPRRRMMGRKKKEKEQGSKKIDQSRSCLSSPPSCLRAFRTEEIKGRMLLAKEWSGVGTQKKKEKGSKKEKHRGALPAHQWLTNIGTRARASTQMRHWCRKSKVIQKSTAFSF